eukprot:1135102-Prorocentrum_minimum.AAC.1
MPPFPRAAVAPTAEEPALCNYFTTISASTGTLSDSPNGPNTAYRDNTECFWSIQPANGDYIQL